MVRIKRGIPGRLGFLFEALILSAVALGLAVLANAAHPTGLAWVPESEPEQVADPSMVELSEAIELLQTGRGLFLDARYPKDFEMGHIPGALSVPIGTYAEEVAAMLADKAEGKVLVAYCSNVQCPLAHRLADALDMIGVEGVRVFEGGMLEWLQSGEPVEKGEPQQARTEAGS